jgi:hypothetical protein
VAPTEFTLILTKVGVGGKRGGDGGAGDLVFLARACLSLLIFYSKFTMVLNAAVLTYRVVERNNDIRTKEGG